MNPNNMNIGFDEWTKLSFSEKREIWNHYWNPSRPEIGSKTKREIVENFIKTTKIKGLQYGGKTGQTDHPKPEKSDHPFRSKMTTFTGLN